MCSEELNFYHHGSMGDIIYSLPTVIAYRVKANYYFRKEHHRDFVYNLLKVQPYIKELWARRTLNGQIKRGVPYVNFRLARDVAWVKRSQHLVTSHLEPFNKEYDLSQSWLHNIEPKHVCDIIINRTLNYHDKEEIDWQLLKPYKDRCIFIGFLWEFERFDRYEMDIEFYRVRDALEVAQIIKGSKIFVGNQSLCFSIAEALKHPRCLEVCYEFNNCQPPKDTEGYTYLNQELLERYLNA